MQHLEVFNFCKELECAGNGTVVDVTRKHWASCFTVVCWKACACRS